MYSMHAERGHQSASGTGAGVLRDFGERSSAPQNRVALASATLPDSSDWLLRRRRFFLTTTLAVQAVSECRT